MEIPRHWRLKTQRYRLEGSKCAVCGQHTFPPRPVCPDCSARAVRITGYEFSVVPPPNHLNHFISLERIIV